MKVTYKNKTLKQSKVKELNIPPKKTVEPGWQFVSGETIQIEHSDYGTKTVFVP